MDWYSVLSDRAQRSGGESGVDTPVLIPNTEVKHSSGENSWASPCEDSTLPGLYRRSYDLLFLFPLFLPPSLFSSLSCIMASVTERRVNHGVHGNIGTCRYGYDRVHPLFVF